VKQSCVTSAWNVTQFASFLRFVALCSCRVCDSPKVTKDHFHIAMYPYVHVYTIHGVWNHPLGVLAVSNHWRASWHGTARRNTKMRHSITCVSACGSSKALKEHIAASLRVLWYP